VQNPKPALPIWFPDFSRAFPYLPWIAAPGSSWFIAVFGRALNHSDKTTGVFHADNLKLGF